ncbi:MAG: acetylglucosaminyldiphospho-UDP acetyl-beta-D-mannosaminyltransferase [Syntrophus sp. (in: bacteria)]|nr:acetylglucosaminyldiphospho-UDP acetyl-beta-D-mannosaminyltransferase [Syntrophus sp. (in: bacteria)]
MEWCKSADMHRYMACANPHSIVVASRDKEFQAALKSADILMPDGYGIALAAKMLGLPLKERVAGSEFFRAFTLLANKDGGLKYFFLGSTKHVLGLMVERLCREFPSIFVCGTYSPPFKEEFSEEDNKKMIDIINSAKPDVLWVGMTAPKQEKWIYQNRYILEVPFIGAIGAVFDFYAGTKQRPSIFWQKLGLEWLPRFMREPRRLWERNLKSTPIFLLWVLHEKLKQNRRNR